MVFLTVFIALVTLAAGAAAGFFYGRGGSAGLTAERDGARAEVERIRTDHHALAERLAASERDAAGLSATLEHERGSAQQHATALQRTIEEMKGSFATISADALAKNNAQFVQLAEQRLKQASTEAGGDLAKRQQAIESLVTPLRESLGKVEVQLRTVEKERATTDASMRAQIDGVRLSNEQLRTETSSLVTALRKPQVRGQWGEMQLRRAAEIAGMLPHCDFDEQFTVAAEDGQQRLDMVVHLAGGKSVVIDAKVSLSAFLEAADATDEAVRAERMKAHVRHVRNHVDELASKKYWERLPATPEFVVMFMPGESLLGPVLELDSDLQEYGARKNVLIVTPTVLIGMLRTIDFAWRQERLAENAREVFEVGRELYSRLATMGGHVDKLGRSLGSAVESYNKTVGSLESRVLSSARKMVELHVVDTPLDTPKQIEVVARTPQAAELVASANDDLIELARGAEDDVARELAHRRQAEDSIHDTARRASGS